MIHIAGQPVQVGSVCRQRCSWCGAVLQEVDLKNVAVHPPPKPGEKLVFEFEVGRLIKVEGTNPTSYHVLPHNDGDQMPAGFCGDEGKPRLRAVTEGSSE